jgi:hypothetical protein
MCPRSRHLVLVLVIVLDPSRHISTHEHENEHEAGWITPFTRVVGSRRERWDVLSNHGG